MHEEFLRPVARLFEAGGPRNLGDRSDAARRRHDGGFLDDAAEDFRVGTVDAADAQPGHAERLGEPVDRQGAAVAPRAEGEDAQEGRLPIGDVRPDFVVHDPQVVFLREGEDVLEVLPRIDLAERVVGVAEPDHPGARRDIAFQQAEIDFSVHDPRREEDGRRAAARTAFLKR